MSQQFRPPAVPLVTVDPYFSIWSTTDRLHEDRTRHWTLVPHDLVGLIKVDGTLLRFLGSTNRGESWFNFRQPSGMRQTAVDVFPTRTRYVFEDRGVRLEVTFLTPLLTDDLDLLSRPFSYVNFAIASIDGGSHRCEIYFEASPGIAAGNEDALMVWDRASVTATAPDLRIGTWEQNRFGRRGDLLTIDWGYLHLMGEEPTSSHVAHAPVLRQAFVDGTLSGIEDVEWTRHGVPLKDAPVLALHWNFGDRHEQAEATAVLGYQDDYSIDYFGDPKPAYCFRNGETFAELAELAINEWPEIRGRCARFDTHLMEEAHQAGGEAYSNLVSLAYRQSVAAHKLIADEQGNPIFLSKECTSNGSIGTVDVSYPSTPLYLLLEPELVAAMLRPVFRFAASDQWEPDYAPHDVGTYPRATGQTYGFCIDRVDHKRQMPVEECGNMLIMSTAYTKRAVDTALVLENWSLLKRWADYLVEHGFDPENQLCTDDFAGHLARNTNLSAKSILAIACFAELCDVTGREDGDEYRAIATRYASQWMEMADDGDHYRLTFDGEATWSLKYNLVWDRYFGFGLFPDELFEKEVSYYLKKADTYGIPLDSRAAFTKSDWLVWSGSLTADSEQRRIFLEYLWTFVCKTPDRTPFCDWYDTHDAREQSFHNRSVIGGILMPILLDRSAMDVHEE